MWRRDILLCAATVFLAVPVHGQSSAPAAAATMERLARQTAAYRKAVPNFTCDEIVTSTLKHSGKVKLYIEFHATIRVVRGAAGGLSEHFFITNYMGKPMPEGGNFTVELPAYVEGGLSQGLPGFLGEKEQACYRYTQQGRRIDFVSDPAAGGPCADHDGESGFALLDEDGELLHGEIRRPEKLALRQRTVTFGNIDYGAVRLNDHTYRLPTHLYAELQDGKTVRTFDAYYTSCKLFQVTATILSAPDVPAEAPKDDAPAPHP